MHARASGGCVERGLRELVGKLGGTTIDVEMRALPDGTRFINVEDLLLWMEGIESYYARKGLPLLQEAVLHMREELDRLEA